MDFTSLYNHHEREVIAAVQAYAHEHLPGSENDGELLADIACVALNRLPPRYIRHEVDYSFYLTEQEREDVEAAIKEAVSYAFTFVQSRMALRAKPR
ncbi:late competence development ComFB family protein [Mitsuaria sp. GD03876]|uniref:late competence development ComFB family protein n=1 Tax=Mitsuaria sp. GD03876 TaxID=2975399 RepID=UPI00244C2E8E|nr:late competence development ComFB family protein [Mitsuaria sp. GD03876]MDH0866230.1 late competence development ComFB family protein [Mitsuaria sp. GD03876]